MEDNCTGCCRKCDVIRDEGDQLKARILELEYICERLEQELADANAIISLIDAETEESYGFMEDAYE